MKMPPRPCGATVLVVGIQSADLNCSCGFHDICGDQVKENSLLRFEKRVVETDKSEYLWHGVAFLVLDGGIACCVGRLAHIYDKTLDHLDGRLAQVTHLFSDSSCPEKIEYSRSNKGVCLATLVDTTIPGDRALNSLLRSIEGNYGD